MVADTSPVENDAPEAAQFSILVADDDRGTRETIGEVLQRQGFRTVLAQDGGEAVEIVQVQMIHLVLFDMHMPRLTGLEALNMLRHTLGRVLPAVLMTADATNELMRQAFHAQVFSVIPKPVNKHIVLHTLARALAQVYGPSAPAAPPQPPTPEPPGGGAPGPSRNVDR